MNSVRFEVYRTWNDEWSWRLLAANGKPIAQGHEHRLKRNAVRAVRLLRNLFDIATPIVEVKDGAREVDRGA